MYIGPNVVNIQPVHVVRFWQRIQPINSTRDILARRYNYGFSNIKS